MTNNFICANCSSELRFKVPKKDDKKIIIYPCAACLNRKYDDGWNDCEDAANDHGEES